MTIKELMAEAYPLHYQRICEAHWDQCRQIARERHAKLGIGSLDDKLIFTEPLDRLIAGDHLASLFIWEQTTEGHEYWSQLAWNVQA